MCNRQKTPLQRVLSNKSDQLLACWMLHDYRQSPLLKGVMMATLKWYSRPGHSMCETQLRLQCRLAGVTAKASLDFVRVLRAALWREVRGGSLKDYLDVGDPRTTSRLLARVGLRGSENPTVLEYISLQPIIRDVVLLEELQRVLTPPATLPYDDRPSH
jgi:hypothetical protein